MTGVLIRRGCPGHHGRDFRMSRTAESEWWKFARPAVLGSEGEQNQG